MRRYSRQIARLAGFALFWLAPAIAVAGSGQVNLDVEPQKASVGDKIEYKIEAHVDGDAKISVVDEPGFPSQLRVIGRRTAPSVVVNNGRLQQSFTKSYTLRATQKGSFTIDPPVVRIGSKRFNPEPVNVKIRKGSSPRARKRKQKSKPEPVRNDKLFVRPVFDDGKTYFIGEQITLRYYLYVDKYDIRIQIPSGVKEAPSFDDFWVEDLTDKRRRRKKTLRHNGRVMERVPLKTYGLFPLKTGEITIEPLKAVLRQLGFFSGNDDLVVESDPIDIQIKPLPDGAPDSFYSGNVGEWSLTAKLDSRSTRVGEPITLEITGRGTGNINRLHLPELPKLDGFRVSSKDTTSRTSIQNRSIGGAKTRKYTLLPVREGKHKIPTMKLSYFDPDAGKYVTVSTDPLTVDVAAGSLTDAQKSRAAQASNDDRPDTDSDSSGDTNTKKLLSKLEPPVTERANLRRRDRPSEAEGGFWWWLLLLTPVAGMALIYLGPVLRRLTAQPMRVGRQKLLTRKLKRRLKGYADSDTPPGIREVAQTLKRYFTEVLGLPPGTVTPSEIGEKLGSYGVSESAIDEAEVVLGEMESVLYNPDEQSVADTREFAREAKSIIETLEGEVDYRSTGRATTMFVLAFGVALLFSPPALSANSPDKDPSHARGSTSPTELFESGQYQNALDSWKTSLRQSPNSVALHYNAGTALAHTGDLARARLALERAHKLAPRNRRIEHNLSIVQRLIERKASHQSSSEKDKSKVQVDISSPSRTIQNGLGEIPHWITNWLPVFGLWLIFLGVVIRRFLASRRSDRVRTVAVTTGAIALGLTAVLWAAEYSTTDLTSGVVIEHPTLREGPNEYASTLSSSADEALKPGMLVEIVDHRGEWIELRGPNNQSGWVKSSSVGLVDPEAERATPLPDLLPGS